MNPQGLMNTCAVRKNAEDKVLGEIGHFKRLAQKRDDLVIGVCGCMAQEESIVNTLLETYRHVNLIFGTHNLHRLPELLYQVMIGHEKSVEVFSKEGDVIENLPVRRFGKYKAWVHRRAGVPQDARRGGRVRDVLREGATAGLRGCTPQRLPAAFPEWPWTLLPLRRGHAPDPPA